MKMGDGGWGERDWSKGQWGEEDVEGDGERESGGNGRRDGKRSRVEREWYSATKHWFRIAP